MSGPRRRTQLTPDRSRLLRERLLGRAAASRAAALDFDTIRDGDSAWTPITLGTRLKRFDKAGSRAALVQMSAGAMLPTHRHPEHEECFVLRGEVQLGELLVREGDYHLAPAGSGHSNVRSPTGALLLLRGAPITSLATMARSVIAAWLLPFLEGEAVTIRADEGSWKPYATNIDVKRFPRIDDSGSELLRLRPGAALHAHATSRSEEFLVVEGEAFFGDQLLQASDYRFARVGSAAQTVSTDVGAVLYRHGAT